MPYAWDIPNQHLKLQEPSWNLEMEAQAINHLYRLGQVNPVNVYVSFLNDCWDSAMSPKRTAVRFGDRMPASDSGFCQVEHKWQQCDNTAHLLPAIIYYSITILWGVQAEWIHIWMESEQVFYPHSCEIKIFISKYDNSLNWETHQVACWAWNQHKLQPTSSQVQLDFVQELRKSWQDLPWGY